MNSFPRTLSELAMKRIFSDLLFVVLIFAMCSCADNSVSYDQETTTPESNLESDVVESNPDPLSIWQGTYTGTGTVIENNQTTGQAVYLNIEPFNNTDTLKLNEPLTLVIDSTNAKIQFLDGSTSKNWFNRGLPYTIDENKFHITDHYTINFTIYCRLNRISENRLEGFFYYSHHGDLSPYISKKITYVTATKID